MNFADPIAWYAHDQARRQQNYIDNQKIIFRRLFDRAVQAGLIAITTLPNRQETVIVKAEPGRVVTHFSHHPDLFRTIPFNSDYLSSNKDALEKTLTQAWNYVISPTPMPHF
jgi:hypothetical protein